MMCRAMSQWKWFDLKHRSGLTYFRISGFLDGIVLCFCIGSFFCFEDVMVLSTICDQGVIQAPVPSL